MIDKSLTIEEALKVNGYYLTDIKGTSMLPLLRQGIDLVKIVPVDRELKVGDVPMFERPNGEYVLHRIIEVHNGYYIICGDNSFEREKVPYEWILGVAESVFLGEREVKMTDPWQIKYAKRRMRIYWLRKLKYNIAKMFEKSK